MRTLAKLILIAAFVWVGFWVIVPKIFPDVAPLLSPLVCPAGSVLVTDTSRVVVNALFGHECLNLVTEETFNVDLAFVAWAAGGWVVLLIVSIVLYPQERKRTPSATTPSVFVTSTVVGHDGAHTQHYTMQGQPIQMTDLGEVGALLNHALDQLDDAFVGMPMTSENKAAFAPDKGDGQITTLAEKLRQLEQAHAAGLLSQEEFERKRQDILNAF